MSGCSWDMRNVLRLADDEGLVAVLASHTAAVEDLFSTIGVDGPA